MGYGCPNTVSPASTIAAVRHKLGSALAVVTVAAGTGLSACGSSPDIGGGGKRGGSMRIGSVLPDSYDPVLFQRTEANQALQLVYKGLVTYTDAEGLAGTKLIPGLAEAMPSISSDRRTYTFKLRTGLRYSDGSPVRASDFEHTIKRLTFLGGPYLPLMSSIEGIDTYRNAKKENADISGITSDDTAGEIAVRLTAPDGRFLLVLGLAAAAPTPAAKSPFKSSRTIPGLGPYTIKIDNPTRQFVLTKTPGFDIRGIAKGNLDTITVVKETVPKMTQDVIDNKLDFMTEDPSGDSLPLIKAKYSERLRFDPNPPNTYWFFMNETVKPFDKLGVRQAVNHAIDSRALQRIFGGRLQPTCNFLPPGYAGRGFEKIDPCPYGDPNGAPNIAKARQLVQQSGYEGMSVTVWGTNAQPVPAVIDYYRDMLNQIGFKAKTKILDSQVYFGTIGLKQTQAQTGFVNWVQDFPHPADFFETSLSEKALQSSPTFNLEFKSNPVVDRALAKLNPAADPATVAAGWAKLDRAVIQNANVAVYGNKLSTSFFSERMDVKNCSGAHLVYENDWSLFCLKQP